MKTSSVLNGGWNPRVMVSNISFIVNPGKLGGNDPIQLA